MAQIDEIRKEFRERLNKGAICPCCDRFNKRYKRKLNSGMARFLISFYRKIGSRAEYVNISSDFPASTLAGAVEYSKLRFWGLLEENPITIGEWRLTAQGKNFVEGKIAVRRHVILLNNQFEGFGDEMTTIQEALGDRFDYAELLSG